MPPRMNPKNPPGVSIIQRNTREKCNLLASIFFGGGGALSKNKLNSVKSEKVKCTGVKRTGFSIS